MHWGIYAALVVVTASVFAYTMRFQGATKYWGKWLAPDNPLLPRGMQDAITPRSQTFRNVLCLLLFAAVAVLGVTFFRWYTSVGGVLGAWLGSGVVAVLLLPKSDSRFFAMCIVNTLERRREAYAAIQSTDEVEALDDMITRLKAF